MDQDDEQLVVERAQRLADLGPRPPWWRILARRRWHRRHTAIMAVSVSRATAMLRSVYSSDRIRDLAERPAAHQMFLSKLARRA